MSNGTAQYQLLLQQEEDKLRHLDQWYQSKRMEIEANASKLFAGGSYAEGTKMKEDQLKQIQREYEEKGKFVKVNIAKYKQMIDQVEKQERQAQ